MAGLDKIRGFDPVSGNPVNINKKVDGNENADMPAFNLQYGEDAGVVYEPSKPERTGKTLEETEKEVAREEHDEALKNVHTRFDGPGVEVSFSREAVKASEEAATANSKTDGSRSIIDAVKETIGKIRDFFAALWNGAPDAGTASGAESGTEINTDPEPENSAAEEESGENIIPKSDTDRQTTILKNDPDSIASFMVNYGGRHLAKNSDLLTQYDKKGNITLPSATDRRRILQGDGKTRKY